MWRAVNLWAVIIVILSSLAAAALLRERVLAGGSFLLVFAGLRNREFNEAFFLMVAFLINTTTRSG